MSSDKELFHCCGKYM